MKMKYLKDFSVRGKTVLLRSDLNSDAKNGRVLFSERISEAASTIKTLKRKGARVVVIAHQGNVGKRDFLDLGQHVKLLNKFVKVKFVRDVIGKKAVGAIKKLKNGEAILLENVRFEKAEFEKVSRNNKLIKALVPLADIYINDAFSVSHREHTSIVGFVKYLPSCAGPLVEKELSALKKINLKNCLYILGGGKPESNIKLLGKNKVLSCGFFGQMVLISKGRNLGYQNKYLEKEALIKGEWRNFLKQLRAKSGKVKTPVDFALNINGRREEHLLEDFPLKYRIDDIGAKTIAEYKKEIKKAKGIYMKGPAGYSTDKKFSKGTVELLKAIGESRAFSIVGGGHLSDAIEKYKINKKKFNHVSLSGGALLNYLAGESLVGLLALEKSLKS